MGSGKAIVVERRPMQGWIEGYGIIRAVVGIVVLALVIGVWVCLWVPL